MKPRNRKILKNTFRVGISLKGIHGVLEIIAGVWLWRIHPSTMNAIVRFLLRHELSRDPRDFIALHLLRTSETLLKGDRRFATIYLLTYGFTNVVFVVGLWMNARWAYPLTIFISCTLSVYQLYRFSHTHSIALLLLTSFDAVIIYLTWMEWREQKAQKRVQVAPLFLAR
jgi:uncharacterized membrane protein